MAIIERRRFNEKKEEISINVDDRLSAERNQFEKS